MQQARERLATEARYVEALPYCLESLAATCHMLTDSSSVLYRLSLGFEIFE